MAETSGFFEAMWDETLENTETGELGDWDRKYLSEEFAKYFSLFIGNGVFGNPTNQLKVLPGDGLSVIVSEGWAFINGTWYHNDSEKVLNLISNDGSANRIDTIRVRKTDVTRETTSLVFTGDSELLRGGTIYDLKLADISVEPNATQIYSANITDTRMNESVCGFVTGLLNVQTTEDLFAQYEDLFNTWFEKIKGQLSEDAAANLQLQVDELSSSIEDLESLIKSGTSGINSYAFEIPISYSGLNSVSSMGTPVTIKTLDRINNNLESGFYYEWLLELYPSSIPRINYSSYIKGARYIMQLELRTKSDSLIASNFIELFPIGQTFLGMQFPLFYGYQLVNKNSLDETEYLNGFDGWQLKAEAYVLTDGDTRYFYNEISLNLSFSLRLKTRKISKEK